MGLNNLNWTSRSWEQVIISMGHKLFISSFPNCQVGVFTTIPLTPKPRTINPCSETLALSMRDHHRTTGGQVANTLDGSHPTESLFSLSRFFPITENTLPSADRGIFLPIRQILTVSPTLETGPSKSNPSSTGQPSRSSVSFKATLKPRWLPRPSAPEPFPLKTVPSFPFSC